MTALVHQGPAPRSWETVPDPGLVVTFSTPTQIRLAQRGQLAPSWLGTRS